MNFMDYIDYAPNDDHYITEEEEMHHDRIVEHNAQFINDEPIVYPEDSYPVDNYMEHELHERPFWKNMKTCSICFKKHQEIVKKHKLLSSYNNSGYNPDGYSRNPEAPNYR